MTGPLTPVRRTRLARILLGLLVAGAMVPAVPVVAQAAATSSNPSTVGAQQAAGSQSNDSQAKAEQEDENAVYKKSASVRAIGRALHLSPEASSSVLEYFNFAILAGFVLFYIVKLVPKAFRERQNKIDQQLVEARTATEEANARLQVVENRLGRLDQEIGELRSKAEMEGAGDEQRIKQSIEDERKKIVAAAEQEIAAASATAERGLRKFAAELAMARALGNLQLTEQQDRALVKDFADGLDASKLRERRN